VVVIVIELNDYSEISFLRFLEKYRFENIQEENLKNLIEEYLALNCENWDLRFFLKLFQDFTILEGSQESEYIGDLFSRFCEETSSMSYIFQESINKKPRLQSFLSQFVNFLKKNKKFDNINFFIKKKAKESFENNSGLEWWFEEIIKEQGNNLTYLFNKFLNEPRFYNDYYDFINWKNRKKEYYTTFLKFNEVKRDVFTFEERRRKLEYTFYNNDYDTEVCKSMVYDDMKLNKDYSYLYIDFLKYLGNKNLNVHKNITHSVLLNYIEQYCDEYGRDQRSVLRKFARNITKKDNVFIGTLSKLFKMTDSSIYRGSKFTLERVNIPLAHGIILFPSYKNISSFLKAYWEDIHHMTGDFIDIYYTLDDFRYNGSGFESLRNMQNLQVESDDLPILIVWENFYSKTNQINLDGLEDIEIFKVIKFFRDCIKENIEFYQCVNETRKEVNKLIQKKKQITKIEINMGSELVMSKYEFNNSQIGAVGDYAKSESSFIMNNAIDSASIESMQSELKEIARILKDKNNRNQEEENLLKGVELLSEINDKNNLLLGIRSRASELLYNLSTGVGSGIIASFVYTYLSK